MRSVILLKAKGIGLLELMLSLAIIAILLIMATRYYQSASNSQKVSQAVDMFAALKSASQNYHDSQGTTGQYPSAVSQLVSAGYLPSSYLDSGASGGNSLYSNPWNGAIAIKAGSVTGTVEIDMTIPDQQSCDAVVNKLLATISTAAGESVTPTTNGVASCASGSNTVAATYAVNQ